MSVLSTTRSPAKHTALTAAGVDHVLADDGHVARQVRRILPDGADAALELVGTPTLPDTLRSVRVHGVACFTGGCFAMSGRCATSTRSTTCPGVSG
jgi:NADPH:quinone reductase